MAAFLVLSPLQFRKMLVTIVEFPAGVKIGDFLARIQRLKAHSALALLPDADAMPGKGAADENSGRPIQLKMREFDLTDGVRN